MLTDIKKYDPLSIDIIIDNILSYSDVKTLISFNCTCKKYKKYTLKIIRLRRFYKANIPFSTINIIKNMDQILKIKLRQNDDRICFDVFKIFLNEIIYGKKYHVSYINALTDLLFLYNERSNYNEWNIYFVNFINLNINLIKHNNKLELWQNIFKLRNESFNRNFYIYLNNKFIPNN